MLIFVIDIEISILITDNIIIWNIIIYNVWYKFKLDIIII